MHDMQGKKSNTDNIISGKINFCHFLGVPRGQKGAIMGDLFYWQSCNFLDLVIL